MTESNAVLGMATESDLDDSCSLKTDSNIESSSEAKKSDKSRSHSSSSKSIGDLDDKSLPVIKEASNSLSGGTSENLSDKSEKKKFNMAFIKENKSLMTPKIDNLFVNENKSLNPFNKTTLKRT